MISVRIAPCHPQDSWGRVRVSSGPPTKTKLHRNVRLFCFNLFAMFYVYIIHSQKYYKYYKGFSENPKQRLIDHNLGKSKYTKSFLPWELVHLEIYKSKSEALIREKKLKKYSKSQIIELSKSLKNKITKIDIG